MERRNWNRDELILTLELYHQIPFNRFVKNNPDIIAFAHMLGRTPGAVAMKLGNLAALDTTLHQQKNVKGLSHGGKLDKEIWEEFENRHLALVQAATLVQQRRHLQNTLLHADMLREGHNSPASSLIRVGQAFFRNAVLCNYENRCCMTGIAIPTLLVASHIKPWKDSDDATEKANPQNGLCLNALHDKAFDQGLITVDNQYRIVVSSVLKKSKTLDETTKQWICAKESQPIQLPERGKPDKAFLEYHQDHVFQHERMV